VTAVLALLCAAGPFALLLGVLALRAINASEGRLRGRPLAVAVLALGLVGTAALALGLFAALLNRWREAANRAACANNLRQIGLAVARYADDHDHLYPPGTLPLAGQPPERRLSWLAGILPILESEAPPRPAGRSVAGLVAYDRPWDDEANRAAASANVARFLCPSDPVHDPRALPGLTNYVGFAGLGEDAAALPKADPRAGFFGYERVIGPADLAAGAAHTLAAAETTSGNGPWIAGGPSTVRGLDPDETQYIGTGRPFGGSHPGGAQVLYADAHTEFLGAGVDPRVLRELVRLTREPPAP
jgi:prepilin-type processing-associated H-X9-DG protein